MVARSALSALQCESRELDDEAQLERRPEVQRGRDSRRKSCRTLRSHGALGSLLSRSTGWSMSKCVPSTTALPDQVELAEISGVYRCYERGARSVKKLFVCRDRGKRFDECRVERPGNSLEDPELAR